MRFALALVAAVSALLVVLSGGCTAARSDCAPDTGCMGDVPALFQVSCAADLTNVVLSGVCSPTASSAAVETTNWAATTAGVSVFSQNPGTCHVQLTFATGFTYATDVMFTQQTNTQTGSGCPPCVETLPTASTPFMVNNPPDTCADAAVGADAAGAPDVGASE